MQEITRREATQALAAKTGCNESGFWHYTDKELDKACKQRLDVDVHVINEYKHSVFKSLTDRKTKKGK